MKKLLKQAKKIAAEYRVDSGKRFRLKDYDAGDTFGFKSEQKPEVGELLRKGVEEIARLQDMLYAHDQWGVLLIFQAMDAAGKDGTIKHVLSGVNPQGCDVHAFKAPSSEELDHDYLWRCMKSLPERGRIGIFNRSYYEETLVVRVHPNLLVKEKLPSRLITKHIWKQRFVDIRNVESYLAHNGIVVRKFFLNVSRKEQERRFLERLDNPDKNWKFSSSDASEREHWADYMEAYEDTIRHTSTEDAPWYVIPADNKWFTRMAVASILIETLSSLDLSFPKVDGDKLKELAKARTALTKKG